MKSKRLKSQMKLIAGGKQLSFIKQTEEVLEFLEHHQFFDEKTDCEWLFSLLEEEEDNLHWIRAHLSLIAGRQSLVQGLECEGRLENVEKAIQHFLSWSADPIGWARNKRSKKESVQIQMSSSKTLTFPLSATKVIEITLPKEGLSQDDFKKLGLFLYPYCSDLDLTKTRSWGDDCPEPPLPHTCT